MSESILDARGRTTVPPEVRNSIGAGPGVRLVWHFTLTGSLSVRAKGPCKRDIATQPKAPRRTA